MNVRMHNVNPGFGTVAPLRNVAEAYSVAQQIINRPPGVDGLGLFYGRSGYGKSKASQYLQNKTGAIYLEVFDFWTRKTFVEALLAELNVDKPKGTISDMMLQALRRLQDDPNRLLIIDEADKLIDKHMIELVRDLYKGARIPVLLVGEELLPEKLARYERCENRVSAFGMANPSDVEDARSLARVYHPKLSVQDDLLDHIVTKTNGVASRIVASLSRVADFARARQLDAIALADYDGEVFTGQAPRRGR
ncbi:ATP-binding protein (plasmid) [Rhizobium lusitanum]|uniref:AAA family ATPase n=1 Tax=Rhizobium lusitanum TaxID=293958 RepID=UPI00161611CD|nr:ATP-binding protein [Rhizobium lusitanum]QND45335.1 ATP-binding protein [Rhizobium lusitanum]